MAQALFTLDLDHRIEALLLALATAEPSIPDAMKAQYPALVMMLAKSQLYTQ